MEKQIALVCLPIIIVLSAVLWRKASIAVMYWIVIAGVFRKWLLPGLSDIIFFFTHLMLTGIYTRFLSSGIKIKVNRSFMFFLVLLVVWGFIGIFNTRSPDIRVGILGFIIHFYFVPFAFIIPRLFRSHEELVDFLKKYALFSLPVLILGIMQYFSPVDSPINAYVSEASQRSSDTSANAVIAIVGDYVRITGTFSYISGYGVYLNAIMMILIYLVSIKKLSVFWRAICAGLIPLVLVNLFMTGSRGPTAASVFSFVAYFVIASRLGVRFILRSLPRIIIILALILGFIGTSYKAREAYLAFMNRAKEQQGELSNRLAVSVTPLKFYELAGLTGWGIGTTYQGSSRFVSNWGRMPRDFEEEPKRVLLELGLVGYFLVYFHRLLIIFLFWKLFKRLKIIDLKLLALCSLLFQIQFIQLNSLIFNHTSGIFYWFFVGFLFLLPRLEEKMMNSISKRVNNAAA